MEETKNVEDTKELGIKMINDTMNKYGLKAKDIPACASAIDWRDTKIAYFSDVIGCLYEKFVHETSEKEAYDWVSRKFDAYTLEQVGIEKPKTFKIATVTIAIEVAVPNNYEDAEIADVALDCDLRCRGSIDVNVTDAEISECDLGHFEYSNDERDFVDSDFFN